MHGQQPPHLLDGDRDGSRGDLRQAQSGFLGVGGLHADKQCRGRQHAEAERHHQRSRRCGEVHVREFVTPPLGTERADVEHLGALHYDRARWPAKVDGIHDQEHIDAAQEFLHEVDATDTDLQHPGPLRQRLGQQRVGHRETDSVVGSQHVAEAGHDRVHAGRVERVAQTEQEVLLERLGRFPAERYPVQHATTQFHLGSVRLHAGEVASALEALAVARDIFSAAQMRLESAKATVMLGAALRSAGRLDEAAAAFMSAGQALDGLDQPAEQAAAAYNLGLVLQDSGDLAGAHAAWSRAREIFQAAGYPAQAAAAARDHGASLLASGQPDDALPLLAQALDLAERAGDEPGAGAAANALGLAHLAAEDSVAAIDALRRALAASPRSVRPEQWAMAKANLALAHEHAGDRPRARLAARQALGLTNAAGAVRTQAQQLLARLPGGPSEDLLAVLDAEHADEWGGVIREELVLAADLPAGQRLSVLSGFLDGVLERPPAAYDLAESLLQILLELPPRPYDLLVPAVVEAVAGRSEDDTARLRAVICSAMARFAIPQWQRLAGSLNAAARALGEPATWA